MQPKLKGAGDLNYYTASQMVTKGEKISAILDGPDALKNLFRREKNLSREPLQFTAIQHGKLRGTDAWNDFWEEVTLEDLKNAFQLQGEDNCCPRYYEQNETVSDGYHLFKSEGSWTVYYAERGARGDSITYSTKAAAVWDFILEYGASYGIPVDLR